MSYDDDENEDDNESQEYECQNEGCQGERVFEAAPESWFEERGMSAPKNCPTCREWFEEQKEIGPISVVCAYCGHTWSIEASYRIIFHKTTGNWDKYWKDESKMQMCRMCVEFPHRRLKLAIRKAEHKYSEEKKQGLLKAIERARGLVEKNNDNERSAYRAKLGARQEGMAATRIDVPADAVFYEGMPTHPSRIEEDGKNRLTHIMKKSHEWEGKRGMSDPGSVLSLVSRIARSSEDPNIKQYENQKNRNIIKYDINQAVVVIICKDSRSLTNFRIVTSYPMEPWQVLGKLENKQWR